MQNFKGKGVAAAPRGCFLEIRKAFYSVYILLKINIQSTPFIADTVGTSSQWPH